MVDRARFTWNVIAAITLVAIVATLCACSTPQPKPSHNEHGGYIEACGDLPPLVGDDC